MLGWRHNSLIWQYLCKISGYDVSTSARPLPLERLKDVPQPVVALLEVLLEKDPGRRFQNPGELLKAMPTITDRIDAQHRITRQSLQRMPTAASHAGTCRVPAQLGPKKISVARLPVTGRDVFGREEDIAFLDAAALKGMHGKASHQRVPSQESQETE